MKYLLFFFFIFLSTVQLFSQDYTWWNNKHNWDEVTHWSKYMIISPSYLGPNALPVPLLKTGSFENNIDFEFAAEHHHSKGDKTTNLFLDLFVPITKDKVGLNVNIVPIEYYKTDTITRDKRISREFDGKGYASGDFYIGTWIQLIKNHNILPDALLTINIKTSSGTKLSGARYSNSSGYFFDLSLGKEIIQKRNSLNHVRLYSQFGFYAFQTNMDNNLQNDAFIYGAGVEVAFKKLIIQNQVTGYKGYLNNGDKPLVYRFILENKNEKVLNYRIQFQQGINDFDYSSIRISAIFKLNKIFNLAYLEE